MIQGPTDNIFSSRRKFIQRLVFTGLGSFTLPYILKAKSTDRIPSFEASPFTILFQGDSITDGNRGRSADPNHIMGHGYAFSIASRLGADYPERNLKFINMGISGNTISDLKNRWQQDTLDLQPNVISILVGINDAHFKIKNNDTSPNDFEQKYRALLDQTLAQYPAVLFVLGEPFTLRVGMVKENPEKWEREVVPLQKIVKKIAADYNAVFIDYQTVFTNACERAPADYWIWDGIHPTVAGHELMTREWINNVSKRLPIITPTFKK